MDFRSNYLMSKKFLVVAVLNKDKIFEYNTNCDCASITEKVWFRIELTVGTKLVRDRFTYMI